MMGARLRLRRWGTVATLVAAATWVGRPALAASITEYLVPTPASYPTSITTGPDGLPWFTEQVAGKIGRVNRDGSISEFPIPAPTGHTWGITNGPDGNLWFTEPLAPRIGRITPGGSIAEYLLPAGGRGLGITAGPDGALWFADVGRNAIGRITVLGVAQEFPLPTGGAGPTWITEGPDGNLWFTENVVNQIGRISTGGSIVEFPVGNPCAGPWGITAGPDGNMWFTEFGQFCEDGHRVGRISLDGTTVEEFPTPSASTFPAGIVSWRGSLWFVEYRGSRLARCNTSGHITELSAPIQAPLDLVPGPVGGVLWLTSYDGDAIIKASR